MSQVRVLPSPSHEKEGNTMIVKCKDNNGIGDCPYKPYCLAAMNDRTITGCNLPLVWCGMIPQGSAVVEHTVREEKNENRFDEKMVGRT